MPKMLKKGDKGEEVKELQKWLKGYGFNCGPIDGIFGSKTEATVMMFQTAAGVVVDGIVGPQTRGAMNQMEKLLGKVDLQIKEDSNTVLLDHFNNNTTGKVIGSVKYENGLPTLNQAVNLAKGSYIKYSFAPWYKWDGAHNWDRNEAAKGVLTEGTIEMWIKPCSYPSKLLNFNWGDVKSYPSAGHILHLGVEKNKKLALSVWGGNPEKTPPGNRIIPLNQWTHIALIWSPNGTKFYVNGLIDSYVPVNCWPAFSGTTFVYLNYWGENDLGIVDELHISKVAMTDKEIFCHVYSLHNVPGCRG